MKVVFIENIQGIANAGDIKDVKPGYLRNYLIPNRLAVPASDSIIKETEELRQAQEKLRKERIQASIEQKDNINGKTFEFISKTDGVNLYASITEKDIINKLDEEFKINLDKKAIKNVKLKTTGEHPIEISLGDGVTVKVTIKISGEEEKNDKKGNKKTKKSEEEQVNDELEKPTKDSEENKEIDL